MNYCTLCGGRLAQTIPPGDDRQRHVCDECGHVHYENPKIIVGSLPCWEEKVLLCKRSIEPRAGFWTLPAGFLENNETTMEGAMRETREEACARIRIHNLYTYYSLPFINQVHMFYRASLLDLDFAAGAESLDVDLFDRDQIPWSDIAFPAVGNTLRHYFNDLPGAEFPLRSADVRLTDDNKRIIKPHHHD